MKKNLSPIDTDVKVPDAVKALGAAADELHAKYYNAEPAAEEPAPEAPIEEPAPATEKPLTAEPPKEEPKVTQQVTDEAWEHRYNSMKGRFERAQTQMTQQAERIASLERLISTLQAQPQTVQSSELKAERLITPEEEADYGPDFLQVVGKKAKEELLPELRKAYDKIAGLEAQLNGVGNYVQQDAQGRMMEALDRDVSGWREQNVNPEFLQWLALPDPYSGDIRHNMLKVAWERHDAPRVAAFFKGFLAEEAAYRGPASSEAPAKAAGKPSLETFAAPGRAKTAAASNAPAEKPIITSAQISRFYADCAAGRYNGRDEEKLKFEKAIFEAQRDGRIK